MSTFYPLPDVYRRLTQGIGGQTSFINQLARNSDVGAGLETLWMDNAAYVWPAAAAIPSVASTDIDDAPADTGARTVLVEGLDEDYEEQSETVIMNGQTEVALVNAYLRINKLRVLTSGTSKVNEGTIWIGTGAFGAGIPANKWGGIRALYGESGLGFFSIPADHFGYLIGYGVSCDGANAVDFEIRASLGEMGLAAPFTSWRNLVVDGLTQYYIDRSLVHRSLKIAEKSDVEMRGSYVGAAGDIRAHMALLLIEHD